MLTKTANGTEWADPAGGSDKQNKITASASGPVATFERITGGMPVNSLEVAITPKQAGSGDPSPTNIRTISGWTGANITRAGKNLFDGTQVITSNTTNWGVSFADDVLTIERKTNYSSGTPTFSLASFPAGTYVISFASQVRDSSISLYTDGAYTNVLRSGNSFTITDEHDYDVRFTADQGTLNKIVKLQFEVGSTATAYEPYAGTTKSISFGQTVYGGTLDVTTGVLTVTHRYVTFLSLKTGNTDWTYDSTNNA
ncbi:MAG: hypothetical protein IJH59_06460, partial [Firmicutes bacterium]|nr:hypothetical protein [Bacillota bacterium]